MKAMEIMVKLKDFSVENNTIDFSILLFVNWKMINRIIEIYLFFFLDIYPST